MTDPRWFKLLIRGVGVLLLGLAIPSVPSMISYFAAVVEQRRQGFPSQDLTWTMAIVESVGVVAQTLFALYLVAGGGALVRYCVRQSLARCPGCDYDLRGVAGQCPECGMPVPEPLSTASPVPPGNPSTP